MNLDRKIGPLPEWAWAALAAVGAVAVIIMHRRKEASAANTQASSALSTGTPIATTPNANTGQVGMGSPSYYFIGQSPVGQTPAATQTPSQNVASGVTAAQTAAMQKFQYDQGLLDQFEQNLGILDERQRRGDMGDQSPYIGTAQSQISTANDAITGDLQALMGQS